jgi:excinuclease ABC subunit B
MYADRMTKSMKAAIEEVDRRREYQKAYNIKHNITPRSISKALRERLIEKVEELEEEKGRQTLTVDDIPSEVKKDMLKNLEEQMREAAAMLDFETAAKIRDQIKELSA